MIVIAALIAGFAFGWMRAARRGGNRLDRTQYALAHAILFGIIGLVVTIVIARMV
jgi:hypothetical protein